MFHGSTSLQLSISHVKDMENMEETPSLIVKRYGKYGRKAS
jgi:hypothetical protein